MCSPARIRDNEGFTIAEVMFSAVIFFFAFTAIMALMTANQLMGNTAKQKTAMINAVAGYIENVRATPFNQIGTSGGTPSGVIRSATINTQGYVVTIVPTITWIDDPNVTGTQNYKKVVLAVTSTGPAGVAKPMSMGTTLFVSSVGSGNNTVFQAPSVGFSYPTTSSGTPILGGGSQKIAVWAQANGSGVTLTTVNVDCDGVPMVLTTGLLAQYPGGGANFTQTLFWNTLATDTSGTPLVRDGVHTLKIEAWDTNSQQGFITLPVYVDNHPPDAPGWVKANDSSTGTGSKMAVTWPVCLDDLTPADHYLIVPYEQNVTSTDPSGLGMWTQKAPVNSVTTASTFSSLDAFSRYAYGVSAVSVSGHTSSVTYGVGITRPLISGTWQVTSAGNGSNKTWGATEAVSMPKPTFPATATATLYRSSSSSMSNPVSVGTGAYGSTGWTWSDVSVPAGTAATQGNNFPGAACYYQVVVAVTPTGFPSATNPTVMLKSNIIGPTGTNEGTGTMANVGW